MAKGIMLPSGECKKSKKATRMRELLPCGHSAGLAEGPQWSRGHGWARSPSQCRGTCGHGCREEGVRGLGREGPAL